MSNFEGRPRPYVGVSGVVDYHYREPSGMQVHAPHQLFVESHAANAGLFETDRMLALGVKATHKTQWQNVENKYGREWYPVGGAEFRHALRHEHGENTLGVAQTYLDVEYVDNPVYRTEFVDRIARRGKGWLQAVQFDMLPWHRDDDMLKFLEDIHENHDLTILLQCHRQAMEQLGPKGVVRKLGRYAADIEYILFDASHGTGQRLDVAALDGFLEEAYASDDLEDVGFAVAGGLNAEIVREDLPPLVAKYPDLSWDAEGQLHPLNNIGTRPLQMDMVKEYLKESVKVINQ